MKQERSQNREEGRLEKKLRHIREKARKEEKHGRGEKRNRKLKEATFQTS
jgi:hypothetical protein